MRTPVFSRMLSLPTGEETISVPVYTCNTLVVGSGAAVRTAVICFYLANEGLSVLENAARMGLPVPDKLRQLLAQLNGK